jgi:hypothetical protein
MIFRSAMIAAIALTTACSGDPSESDKRAQAQEYYRTTSTVIPANNEIITFPALPAHRPTFAKGPKLELKANSHWTRLLLLIISR